MIQGAITDKKHRIVSLLLGLKKSRFLNSVGVFLTIVSLCLFTSLFTSLQSYC